ncbi:MAG: family glycosyltransferase [Herminiimonas sp.]|nr:family glycosyltransferase [Herminiimonas sp.]
MQKPHIVIISPALANANNGNWQTANRWARFLRTQYHVTIAKSWNDAIAAAGPDTPRAMIALHARRSAESIAEAARSRPALPIVLALTGTDLYRDIHNSAEAQRSMQLARHLVVLQSAGLEALPPAERARACVIYQSAAALKPVLKSARATPFDVVMIGHLRSEKDPLTFMRAAALLDAQPVRLTHIGGALDPELGAQALATQSRHACYRWRGNLPHAATRQALKRSQLLVIASRIEGGANVIIEAVTSGVPVLASDIAGNRGMLGDDYDGYFPVGDSDALAHRITQISANPALHARLAAQCAGRAPLFAPERERAALLQLMDNVLN